MKLRRGLREGRVIGHVTFQAEPAKPPIRQVKMDLFAQPALRTDAEAIANEQHAYQQLGIDRRTPDLTVEGSQMSADSGQVDKPVDRTQQVIGRQMAFETELVK